jgi:UDP-2,3-diacylglucosamine hydrolase
MSQPLARYLAGEKPVVVYAKAAAVFTDLHLSPSHPEEIQTFVAHLVPLAGRADALIILGDLFDAYLGREDFLHPVFDHLRAAIRFLHDRGCPTYLVRGNRDVLLSANDGKHLGFVVVDSILLQIPHGSRVLLTHGDAFCLADLPYQRLRRILRFPGLRTFLRGLPLRLRRRIARRLRGYSVQEVARKPLDSLALTLSQVAETMLEVEAEFAVIGHLHAFARHDLGSGRTLLVLPAWDLGTAARMVPEMLDETI